MKDTLSHSFNVEIASEVSMAGAVIYNNIKFWMTHNKTKDQNFFDGYYWTYNSTKAFAEFFPYLTQRQIRTALNKLEDAGYIITGNYNKMAYDQTKWYTIPPISASKPLVPTNRPGSQMELTPKSNGIDSEVKPIPVSKPKYKRNQKQTNPKNGAKVSRKDFPARKDTPKTKAEMRLEHGDGIFEALNDPIEAFREEDNMDYSPQDIFDIIQDQIGINAAHWFMSDKDERLLLGLIKKNPACEGGIIDKLCSNITSIKITKDKSKQRFGNVVVGLNELNYYDDAFDWEEAAEEAYEDSIEGAM
jgi:hypothetical protein